MHRVTRSKHDLSEVFFALFAQCSDIRRQFSVVRCDSTTVFVPACFLLATKLLSSEQNPAFDIVEPRPRWRLSVDAGRGLLFPAQFLQQLAVLHWPPVGA